MFCFSLFILYSCDLCQEFAFTVYGSIFLVKPQELGFIVLSRYNMRNIEKQLPSVADYHHSNLHYIPLPVFVNLLRSPGIDSQPGGLARRTARLHRLAESISWNWFLGSLNVYKFGLSSRMKCMLWKCTSYTSICLTVCSPTLNYSMSIFL
jgi:hypothetical protein